MAHVSADPDDSRVRRFFTAFSEAKDALNLEHIGACYADPFTLADAGCTRAVRRAAFLEALPRRAQMFADAGLGAAVLTALDETRLDQHYVLVRTEWNTPHLAGGEPVHLASSFLLHDDGAHLRIVLYLNHEGLPQPQA